MSTSKTYFLSDLHLGAACHNNAIAHEQMIVQWLESIAPHASAVYFLGDVIDYWFEYQTVVPRGYVRFLGQIARMADSGIKIVWLKGNHDMWMTNYLSEHLGIEIIDGILDRTIDGKRFVLEHGDGMGEQSRGFKILRQLFRNPVARRLFAGIHPRWTVGLAHRWSAKSRSGGAIADSHQITSSVDALAEASQKYLQANPGVDYFIYGHLHVVDNRIIDSETGARMILLGDWIDKFTYATYAADEGLITHQFKP
ncbi:MAG: UDP-2,3-diacylglucosamine diphosphatase [Muribaculaceae bacterium]|nr:UDP-2,3-diacylglucosamine diphosphatase [Muribaculaceae bacterium]